MFQWFQGENTIVAEKESAKKEHATININTFQADHAEMNPLRDQIAVKI